MRNRILCGCICSTLLPLVAFADWRPNELGTTHIDVNLMKNISMSSPLRATYHHPRKSLFGNYTSSTSSGNLAVDITNQFRIGASVRSLDLRRAGLTLNNLQHNNPQLSNNSLPITKFLMQMTFVG